MAKAKVLDDKVVITSEILTNENIEKVSILKPSVLALKDEDAETSKVLYEVAKAECNSFTTFGALFNNGKTIGGVTINDKTEEEKKDIMRHIVTSILIKINAIEAQVEEYLEEADELDVDIEILG